MGTVVLKTFLYYLFFIIIPIQFSAHQFNNPRQGFLCCLDIQKGQASATRNHIHRSAGILLNPIFHLSLNKSEVISLGLFKKERKQFHLKNNNSCLLVLFLFFFINSGSVAGKRQIETSYRNLAQTCKLCHFSFTIHSNYVPPCLQIIWMLIYTAGQVKNKQYKAMVSSLQAVQRFLSHSNHITEAQPSIDKCLLDTHVLRYSEL